jgi:hypothetical protein
LRVNCRAGHYYLPFVINALLLLVHLGVLSGC